MVRSDLSVRLREHSVSREALPSLAEEAAAQWTGQFNPRPFDAAGAVEIYEWSDRTCPSGCESIAFRERPCPLWPRKPPPSGPDSSIRDHSTPPEPWRFTNGPIGPVRPAARA